MESQPMRHQRRRCSKKSIDVAEWLARNVWLGYYDKTDSRILFLWLQQLLVHSLQIVPFTISMSFDLSFSLSLKTPRKSLFKEDQTLLVRAESHHVDCSELATSTVVMTAAQRQCYYIWLYLFLYIRKLFLSLQKSFPPVIKIDKINWHSCRIFATSTKTQYWQKNLSLSFSNWLYFFSSFRSTEPLNEKYSEFPYTLSSSPFSYLLLPQFLLSLISSIGEVHFLQPISWYLCIFLT